MRCSLPRFGYVAGCQFILQHSSIVLNPINSTSNTTTYCYDMQIVSPTFRFVTSQYMAKGTSFRWVNRRSHTNIRRHWIQGIFWAAVNIILSQLWFLPSLTLLQIWKLIFLFSQKQKKNRLTSLAFQMIKLTYYLMIQKIKVFPGSQNSVSKDFQCITI